MKGWNWYYSMHATNLVYKLKHTNKTKKQAFDEVMKTNWVNEKTAWGIIYNVWKKVT